METLQNWTWFICGGAVLCGLFDLLLPIGNSKKSAKLVLSLLFLSTMLTPLKQNITMEFPQLSLREEEHLEVLQQRQKQLAYSLAEDHILELTQTALEDAEIHAETILLSLSENSLSIELTLPLSLRDREGEVRHLIRQSCGAEEIIIHWQEEVWMEPGETSLLS